MKSLLVVVIVVIDGTGSYTRKLVGSGRG